MGLEGAVKLGFRKELAAVADPHERRALFDTMVERMYRHGKAVNAASHFEIDDVIDPAESRRWIASALAAVPDPSPRRRKKRPCIDRGENRAQRGVSRRRRVVPTAAR